MLEIEDFVVFGATGVCRIVDIVQEKFDGNKDREYFVLNPVYNPSATIYIPTANKAKMRQVLTREEIMALIGSMPELGSEWILDEKLRKVEFAEIIKTNEPHELVKLIKILHARQTELAKIGKKLSSSDTEAIKSAEKLLHSEFALVLNIELDQVVPFILGQIRI